MRIRCAKLTRKLKVVHPPQVVIGFGDVLGAMAASAAGSRTIPSPTAIRFAIGASTTIDLCLSLFPWARAAVKLHTSLDLRGSITSWVVITDGKVQDVNLLDQLVIEAGAFSILLPGLRRLYRIHQSSAFFCHVSQASSSFNAFVPNPSTDPPGCCRTKSSD